MKTRCEKSVLSCIIARALFFLKISPSSRGRKDGEVFALQGRARFHLPSVCFLIFFSLSRQALGDPLSQQHQQHLFPQTGVKRPPEGRGFYRGVWRRQAGAQVDGMWGSEGVQGNVQTPKCAPEQ